jgi:heterodisulfide reductase subunit A
MPDKPRVGVFICHCGRNIAGTVSIPDVAGAAKHLPGVVHVGTNLYCCSEPGQKAIRTAIAEHHLDRVVVAACSPRMHEPTFRACSAEAGLSPSVVEMANIREGCSWVHLREPALATAKARDLVRMAVGKAGLLESLRETRFPVKRAAMVVGGGIAGIQAALDMADAGIKVYLVERASCLGGTMAQLNKTYPTMDCAT